MTAGSTGMATKHLLTAGIPHIVSTTHSGSHAGYYPDARQMSIQIAFDPESGILLGAQVAGYEGADKRLDVLAMAVKNKMTVYDLAEFEHAYAPPYSSAKDPVNMAGFVAENLLTGRLKVIPWSEIGTRANGTKLIDVRTPKEFSNGSIPDAINIPVDDLRERLNELKKNEPIIIYCQIGLRGYLAQRILLQRGFTNVKNMSGGYALWKVCNDETTLRNK